MIVVLPDKEVDLGVVAEGDLIITHAVRTPIGITYEAVKEQNSTYPSNDGWPSIGQRTHFKSPPALRSRPRLNFEILARSSCFRIARVTEGSYQGTRDCVGEIVVGSRQMIDAVASASRSAPL